MIRSLIPAALLAVALPVLAQTTAVVSPARKELVQKVLTLQQPGFEGIARSVVERPALQLMQAAGQALQQQVPPERREAAGRSIEADIKKFVEESVPVMRDRAIKLAPSTFGAVLEEKFSEDELKQLIAWLDSPLNKKFQQTLPEVQNGFVQKLVADAAPVLDPKLQALQQKIRSTLTTAAAAPASSATSPASAAPPRPAASAASARR